MRIVLASTGQPSTNPRLVKEANALTEAGYNVKVYYCFWNNWASITDANLLKMVKWEYELVGGSFQENRVNFILSKLKFKFYQIIGKYGNFSLEKSIFRAYDELLTALKRDDADHFIAHNLGALAPVANAAKYHQKTFSFDAEDFHRGQFASSCRDQEISVILENRYLPKAKFVTTASPLINEEYSSLYPDQRFITINNVFPKEEFSGSFSYNYKNPLKLVWFSQTIGLNRGLENIIDAVNEILEYPVEIHLFGNYSNQTQIFFKKLLKNNRHKLNFYYPISPKDLNQRLSFFDIGIATEITREFNRDICLTNKIFSFMQAGLCLLASKTKAQSRFLREHPNIGFAIDILNTEEIKNILKTLHYDRELLHKIKKSSIETAKNLNWDNEKSKIIKLL